ncbi:hypothetical protein VIBNIAM115_1110046 [Vibrio nigripulchritudo AM115]|nr:hypothetical protein VIBNIAM115_1110046 [Vibrio nigripulchritudo AM115]
MLYRFQINVLDDFMTGQSSILLNLETFYYSFFISRKYCR